MKYCQMVKQKWLTIFFMSIFIVVFTCPVFASRNESMKLELDLNSGWEFRQAGMTEWLPAQVPGCVHTDLLNAEKIPNPFAGDNEKDLQWIGKTAWEYRMSFDVKKEWLDHDRIQLEFDGLDTYADVFLNGQSIIRADNMFRKWAKDVKSSLNQGKNQLLIRFRSPIHEVLPIMEKMAYRLPASNDQGEKTSPHTRKAPYHFGWDWGPRYVTCGIWKPVRLEMWNDARIEDVHIKQKVARDRADLNLSVSISSVNSGKMVLIVESPDQEFKTVRKSVQLLKGENTAAVDVSIPNPVLWWPNGMGGQPLYDVRIRLKKDGNDIDSATKRIGIRTLELKQEPDQWGKSFTFVVNGIPIFAKGGNWIPADSFTPRVSDDKYRHLLESFQDANMNMVRVWGGGIYESDIFYDLCDEMGLLVWQDFMFACSMYPGHPRFLLNVRREAEEQVRRLRHHPSIALWCGNNEIETAWHHWGWQDRNPPSVWNDYESIFHELLPEVVQLQDPERTYWPSSPSSNGEADAGSQEIGDVHYWNVWHGAAPFEDYETHFPRFNSEFGFQSFPLIETVRTYASSEDENIESDVMKAHQKHPRGNELIREYMLLKFPEPKDFESFLIVSQILQAEGIRVGAEHLRRIMPQCMGSLYWQLNDCWPVASWSSIDYFGRWKALHYFARHFYANLLISPNEVDDGIDVFVVSDLREPTTGTLRARLMDFSGNVAKDTAHQINVAPRESRVYLHLPKNEWADMSDKKGSFLFFDLVQNGKTVASNRHFFVPVKEMVLPRPEISWVIEESSEGIRITLKSDVLARYVYLSIPGNEGRFSDNFFDLISREERVVVFQSVSSDLKDVKDKLVVQSIVDCFK